MISILIPTFNFNCLRLVTDLQQQCEELQAQYGHDFDYEIIVADDASTQSDLVEQCELIELLPGCQYVRMQENVGRALLCNWLFQQAQLEYLLLIDADAEVISEDFLLRYWQCRREADVIVGGLCTPDTAPTHCALRHRYELSADAHRSLDYRLSHPYEKFTTFNVLLAKQVVEQLPFDTRCIEYGYEDALMGMELEKAGYKVLHIDNPLLHTGINDSQTFLRNTEAALRNLVRIGSPLTKQSGVVRMHQKLHRLGVLPLFRQGFRLLRQILRRQLLSSHPLLWIFAIYKVGVYDQILASNVLEKQVGDE